MSTQKTGIQFAPDEHMWTLSVLAPGGTGVFTVPLRTNSRGEGLWVGNRQVLGDAQFQLPASESARKRKMVWAAMRYTPLYETGYKLWLDRQGLKDTIENANGYFKSIQDVKYNTASIVKVPRADPTQYMSPETLSYHLFEGLVLEDFVKVTPKNSKGKNGTLWSRPVDENTYRAKVYVPATGRHWFVRVEDLVHIPSSGKISLINKPGFFDLKSPERAVIKY